jgi:orotate phosphoribosyltransferase
MERIDSQKETAEKVAAALLEIEAIKLNVASPFTWASGWKSPIYCDNRMSLSFPKIRKDIKLALVEAVKNQFPAAEAIAGVATAGIPQGALLADALDLPFIYVRSKPKGHGMTNLIEGKAVPGQKVVVLEDLVSTGGSSIKAAKDLQAVGIEVMGMLAIFTYGFPIADQNFREAGITLHTLSNYNTMLDEALRSGYISADDLETLREWRESPSTWKQG